MVAVLWEAVRGWRAATSGVVPPMVTPYVVSMYAIMVLDIVLIVVMTILNRRRRRALGAGIPIVGYKVDFIGANAKAEELLMTYLSPTQKKSYETNKGFWVRSKLYGDDWWWWLSHSSLPQLWLANKIYRHKRLSLCIHLHGVPRADELLAFKFSIEADEGAFMRTGNVQAVYS